MSLELTFTNLTEHLTGRTEADVFINVEADLVVRFGDLELFAEVCFPVVELAAALREWKAVGE